MTALSEILAAFRKVTGWTDAEVLHYAVCESYCTPICDHEEDVCPDGRAARGIVGTLTVEIHGDDSVTTAIHRVFGRTGRRCVMDSRRQTILNTVEDLVGALMYYDRKEDEDLPRGSIEEAISIGEITPEEIVAHFAAALQKAL